MRVDDAGPRTWLLATAAGWALLVWLLAIAGMGGHVEPLPADASLLKPLPALRPVPAVALGPLGQYSEIASRPLFADDRRLKPFFLQGEGEVVQTQAFDYVLTSVLITPGLNLAILQPADGSASLRVKLGESPEPQPQWRLVALNPRSAVFEGPDGQRTMDLRVFDGVGGAAPTSVSSLSDNGAGRVAEAPMPPMQEADEVQMPNPPVAPPTAGVIPGSPPGMPPPPMPQGAPPATDQAQMEAIRQRIQQRRAKLREDSSSQPPANSP